MGWWIRTKDGKVFSNQDHYEFVKAHPKLFGFPNEIRDYGLDERTAIIEQSIKNGWIRVRGDRRQGIACEIARFDGNTLWSISEFLTKQKWDPDEKVLVDDGRRTLYEKAVYFTQGAALSVVSNKSRRGRPRR
jgi:hypothetical protein